MGNSAVAFVVVVLLCLVGESLCVNFTNPLNSAYGADPFMRYYNGNFYLMTSGLERNVFTMKKASTIAKLKTAAEVRVWTDSTASRCCNFWAPEFYQYNGLWYIYYTAGTSANFDGQKSHVLVSSGSDPLGPYSYKARLRPTDWDGWSIDGSVLDLNSKLYFMFSSWDGPNQNMYIAPMSNPYTISGPRALLSTPTYAWEKVGNPVNEGPVAISHNGVTHVVYSASYCVSDSYALGVLTLTGSDPLKTSSWTKKTTPAFIGGTSGVYGTGHNGFFKSPDGKQDWFVFHANNQPGLGCGSTRTTRIQRVGWFSNNAPNFFTPIADGVSLAGPSGEK